MTDCRATILDPDVEADRERLAELQDDPGIEIIDRVAEQSSALRCLLPKPDSEVLTEPHRWAYYPWRRTLVSILGPAGYRRLRSDRNRNLISTAEQDRLQTLTVGVVGLSVGHAIAYALAAQGLCGRLRLADFDTLDLSNLNRVAATLFDLGENKAKVAARRIAELDPYLPVDVLTTGVDRDNVAAFLADLDVVVEECDSLDMKMLVRESAREHRLPVLMATSDRGLVDVERFDLEPQRPVFHGLLPDVDSDHLAALTSEQKIPYVLRMIDAGSLSARGAASLIEVGHTLSTWPQLAGDVELGGSAIAEAVRRIGLGEPLSSGRVRVDVGAALDDLHDPLSTANSGRDAEPDDVDLTPSPTNLLSAVVTAAARAPSGGNVQPWRIEADTEQVVIDLDPNFTSSMDVGFRGSAVAVGAAAFNAQVAAAAHQALGRVEFIADDRTPLRATVCLNGGTDTGLAALYPAILDRETNRRLGAPRAIDAATVTALKSAARHAGTAVHLLSDRARLERAAEIFAAADRIRYLTPHLHAEMMSELRWPGDDAPDWGIDVRSLELAPAQLLILDILRRPDVMAKLTEWDAGTALGSDARTRVLSSSALAVVTVRGRSLVDYAWAGATVAETWVAAQQRGLAVQPISPVFLYAHTDTELRKLSPGFADDLRTLQSDFAALLDTDDGEAHALVLRLSYAPPASTRSRRRALYRDDFALR